MQKRPVFLFLILIQTLEIFALPDGKSYLDILGKAASDPEVAAMIEEIEFGQHNATFDRPSNTYEINAFEKGIALRFNQNFILKEIQFYDSGYLYSQFQNKLPLFLEMRMHIDWFTERFQNFSVDTFNQFIYHGSIANGSVDVYFKDRHIELIKIIGSPSFISKADQEGVANWGMRVLPTGKCIEGSCLDSLGKMSWGSMEYDGEWSYGIPNGSGSLNDTSGLQYSGNFRLGFLWGEGRLKVPNQYQYKGGFIMGKRYGKGEIRYPNGTKYFGDWQNDLMDGYGKFSYSENYYYEGYFRDNVFNGKGTLHTPEGYITCNFKNGKPNGYGKQVATNNNATLEGKWENGKKEGEFKVFNPMIGEFKAIFENDIEVKRFREED